MIYRSKWHMDKEDANKDTIAIEPGAIIIPKECWIWGEEVEVGTQHFIQYVETKGQFRKLIVPDSVTIVEERAFYRMETLEEISVLTSVTEIGKEAFKGCTSLREVVAPNVKVSSTADPDTKMKLAFGFCGHAELYSEEIAADYLKYLKSNKTRILQTAEKYGAADIKAFLISAGIVPDSAPTKGAKNAPKLSKKDAALLLERSVLSGSKQEIETVIKQYEPFEMTARALGLACRCRTSDIVSALLKHKANFTISTNTIAAKYGLLYKPSGRCFYAQCYLLPVVNNIWNKYLFGEMDRFYAKTDVNITHSDYLNADIDMSGIPQHLMMQEVAVRIENIRLLKEATVLRQQDLNQMLYYAVLEESPALVEALENLGAVIDVPWLLASAKHTDTVSELNQHLDALNRKSTEHLILVLRQYNQLLQKVGAQMYISENVLHCLSVNRSPAVVGVLLENGDVSSINKTTFMKRWVSRARPEMVQALVEHGFITTPKLRDELIKIASENGKTEMLALLMNYKNQTADLQAEATKQEKKLTQELCADPDSAYELKKRWNIKKKDDGTLIITGYKGTDTQVVVPKKIGNAVVSEVGEEAFSPEAKRIANKKTREEITDIVIPESVIRIGNSAFAGCRSLKNISLPDSIETFGVRVFLNCENLTELKLPQKTRGVIRWYFFGSCKNLERLYVPSKVTAITEWAFDGCTALRELHLKKGTKKFDFSGIECAKHLTIYAPAGSYAETYAKEHNIPFEAE
jgi:hypothetical protein